MNLQTLRRLTDADDRNMYGCRGELVDAILESWPALLAVVEEANEFAKVTTHIIGNPRLVAVLDALESQP